jgi:hypothetical protein
MRTIVPPVLLVRMFGVPESVTMPRKIGQEITFTAYDRLFHCKRVRRDCWWLSAPLSSPRCRFGTADEIAADIGHVLETGNLPESKNRMC